MTNKQNQKGDNNKIVNLNEDLSGHKHDTASFNKVMANQNAIKEQIKKQKESK